MATSEREMMSGMNLISNKLITVTISMKTLMNMMMTKKLSMIVRREITKPGC